MNVLILGSGGREHALTWKLAQSPRVEKIFCAPGNAGIGRIATCVPIPVSEIDRLIAWAKEEQIGLTVVGPDDALAAGVADRFQSAGLRIFGPSQNAARLEFSKVFAKEFMERHGIPTAQARRFVDAAEAERAVLTASKPVVIKADGLALGKGVIIAQTDEEALEAIQRIMVERVFGEAGAAVVVEEFLEGVECSIHALVDGDSYLLFPGAQDHKRALDQDEGPNTGGMGTLSPTPALTPELQEQVRTQVLDRLLAGLRADGIDYRGMIFPGLMITEGGVKVLEFNCRFGDPETQVLLMRLESDLLDLLEATIDRQLKTAEARWSEQAAVCVILASGGYPGKYETGKPIGGLEQLREEVEIFHAGTKTQDGEIVTAGGRVLGVTARGVDLQRARRRAYGAVEEIRFEGVHFRRDIGARFDDAGRE